MNKTIVKTENDFEVMNKVCNPSEFERTKPTVTYTKIRNVLNNIQDLKQRLDDLEKEIISMRNSFLKGE